MNITVNDALSKFTSIVQGDEYHPNYKRTIGVAEDAYIFGTGDKVGKKVTSVRKRESSDQKKQRVEITKVLTPVSCEMIKKYYRKLRKTDGVKSSIEWTPENRIAKDQFQTAFSSFYAQQNVKEFLFDTLENYTFLDPNAYLVVERENVADEQGRVIGVKVYPSLFEAKNIRQFYYRHGVLNWLLIEETHKEKTRGLEQSVSEFRMYGIGFVLHAVEYIDNRPDLDGYSELNISLENTHKTKKFLYRIYLNGTTEVPAMRLSAYLDGQTKGQTGVTPMEPVNSLLEQLINIGSLHDLTVFLHSIPRRKELVEACDYNDPDTSYQCEGGYLGESICPSCKGTGDKSIKSEQDMIRITLPQNFRPEDIPDLAKMAHVESADVELLRWQQEKIDWLLKFIVYATMTRDAVTMAEVSRTATELNLNNQDSYDKIQPYAELYSQAFMLIARITTQYQETANGFTVSHHFPDDYQFETENDLLDKLEKAIANKAPYNYIQHLKIQLIQRQTRSKEEAEKAATWEMWKPWPDVTDELLSLVLAERDPRDHDRVLRENFTRVRREIEQETNNLFYLMPYETQETRINNKVNELIESIRFRVTEPVDFDINPLV